jgi:hypothetical protein
MEWLQSVSDHIVELVLSCTEDLLHEAPGHLTLEHIALNTSNGIRQRYREETLSQDYETCHPTLVIFACHPPQVCLEYARLPIFMQLFNSFWTKGTLRAIVADTNRLAKEVFQNGQSRGGEGN